jgi:hypothetical protein
MPESTGFTIPTTVRRARLIEVAAALGILVACTVMLVITNASADGGRTTVVLGKTSNPPTAACPTNTATNPCQVIVRTTGFQTRNDQTINPMRVPFKGKVTAWNLSVGQPSDPQRGSFNGRFGRPPEAHLAVLRHVRHSKPVRYQLRRQSPIKVLTPFFGQTVHFKLTHPMPVHRGDIIAISVPTWAPTFSSASTLSQASNKWRASRLPGRCGGSDAGSGRPQQIRFSRRTYGCNYSASRLLYTATVVRHG